MTHLFNIALVGYLNHGAENNVHWMWVLLNVCVCVRAC